MSLFAKFFSNEDIPDEREPTPNLAQDRSSPKIQYQSSYQGYQSSHQGADKNNYQSNYKGIKSYSSKNLDFTNRGANHRQLQSIPEKGSFYASISENKDQLFLPKLEIEGSKGSQYTMRSMNSISSKMFSGKGSDGTPHSARSANNLAQRDTLGLQQSMARSVMHEDTDRVKMSKKLIDAIKVNDESRVYKIISKGLADINCRGENDWTPLHFSCWAGNAKFVNQLLIYKADVNLKARNQLTPLMITCHIGNQQIFNILTMAGAKVSDLDGNNSSCLHYAAQSGNKAIVQDLINFGLPLDNKNAQGKLPEDCTSDGNLYLYMKERREANDSTFIPLLSYTFDRIKNLFSSEDDEVNSDPSKIWPTDFEIISLLGKGSFGQVYLVKKKKTGNKYAMKVLLKSKVMGKGGVTRSKLAKVCDD